MPKSALSRLLSSESSAGKGRTLFKIEGFIDPGGGRSNDPGHSQGTGISISDIPPLTGADRSFPRVVIGQIAAFVNIPSGGGGGRWSVTPRASFLPPLPSEEFLREKRHTPLLFRFLRQVSSHGRDIRRSGTRTLDIALSLVPIKQSKDDSPSDSRR